MTVEELISNRPRQTPAQAREADQVIAALKMNRGPQPSDEAKEAAWRGEGDAGRREMLLERGINPDAESPVPSMSMASGRVEELAPISTVELLNALAPATPAEIMKLFKEYDAAWKAVAKLEAESVPSNDPAYADWKIKSDRAIHEKGKALTALAAACRNATDLPKEFKDGGKLNPDQIEADRERARREATDNASPTEREARKARDAELRQRGYVV